MGRDRFNVVTRLSASDRTIHARPGQGNQIVLTRMNVQTRLRPGYSQAFSGTEVGRAEDPEMNWSIAFHHGADSDEHGRAVPEVGAPPFFLRCLPCFPWFSMESFALMRVHSFK